METATHQPVENKMAVEFCKLLGIVASVCTELLKSNGMQKVRSGFSVEGMN